MFFNENLAPLPNTHTHSGKFIGGLMLQVGFQHAHAKHTARKAGCVFGMKAKAAKLGECQQFFNDLFTISSMFTISW